MTPARIGLLSGWLSVCKTFMPYMVAYAVPRWYAIHMTKIAAVQSKAANLTAEQAASHLMHITDADLATEAGRMVQAVLIDHLAALVPAVDAALDTWYEDLDSTDDQRTVALAAYVMATA